MGKEEQIEEREVLDSIFPDEIQDISETEFRISILLDSKNDDDDDSEAPSVLLLVKFPDEYPDVAPVLDLLAPPNAPIHRFFSLSGDKQALLDGLNETIEENIGMAMIFTIVSTLKDNAEQLITERQAGERRANEQRLEELEREENKKFHGTQVNRETFMEWRDKFRREMEELKLKEEAAAEEAEKKRNKGRETVVQLTGKQLWERGLVGKVEEDDEDDDTPVDDVEKLKVTA